MLHGRVVQPEGGEGKVETRRQKLESGNSKMENRNWKETPGCQA